MPDADIFFFEHVEMWMPDARSQLFEKPHFRIEPSSSSNRKPAKGSLDIFAG